MNKNFSWAILSVALSMCLQADCAAPSNLDFEEGTKGWFLPKPLFSVEDNGKRRFPTLREMRSPTNPRRKSKAARKS